MAEMSVKELERQTGYTRRYLDLLFKQYVGFCPKVLARIFRFQKFYRKSAEGLPFETLKEDLYTFYYDQAHFTKEFKRMTGYSPRNLLWRFRTSSGVVSPSDNASHFYNT